MGTHAFIDEQVCIGCTLCIQACPVDAILGAAKQMHTIIIDECTGCEDCIEPCPVDCIQMLPFENQEWSPELKKQKSAHAEQRRLAQTARLERLKQERTARLQRKQAALKKTTDGEDATKAAIEAAIKRVAAKKAALNIQPKNTGNLSSEQQAQIDKINSKRNQTSTIKPKK